MEVAISPRSLWRTRPPCRYPEHNFPPALWVCPPHLLVKPDKVHMVRDRSNPRYGLTGVFMNREAGCGAMDGFLARLCASAYMASCWRPRRLGASLECTIMLLGVLECTCRCHSVSGRPMGSGNRCVEELIRGAARLLLSFLTIDFVRDLRLVSEKGGRARLASAVARFMELPSNTGARCRAEESKC